MCRLRVSLIWMLILWKFWCFNSWGKQFQVWEPSDKAYRGVCIDCWGIWYSINFFSYIKTPDPLQIVFGNAEYVINLHLSGPVCAGLKLSCCVYLKNLCFTSTWHCVGTDSFQEQTTNQYIKRQSYGLLVWKWTFLCHGILFHLIQSFLEH